MRCLDASIEFVSDFVIRCCDAVALGEEHNEESYTVVPCGYERLFLATLFLLVYLGWQHRSRRFWERLQRSQQWRQRRK